MYARHAARHSRSSANGLSICGRIRGRGRMSARRAARRSRFPSIWLGTCGRIQGRNRLYARSATWLSARTANLLHTCARIQGRSRMSARRAVKRFLCSTPWLCTIQFMCVINSATWNLQMACLWRPVRRFAGSDRCNTIARDI